jgi:1,4-alpha-glucan branching enzyme
VSDAKSAPRKGPAKSRKDEALAALVEARLEDTFAYLGMHRDGAGLIVRCFRPDAETVHLVDVADPARSWPMVKAHPSGVFTVQLADAADPFAYRLRITAGGATRDEADPYSFGSAFSTDTIAAAQAGWSGRAHEVLGARPYTLGGVEGYVFAVWAPHARRVAVLGDFNGWDNRRHPMRKRHEAGVWELFVPGLHAGGCYKFEIMDGNGHRHPLKADPYAFQAQLRPDNASILAAPLQRAWRDDAWMAARGAKQAVDAPVSIYEVHLGSWRRGEGGRWLSYDELADTLIPYALEMGFTHVQLLPVTEYPFDASWGYQPTGLFAPTSRFGSPESFARFVERCHEAGLGVLADYVPAHFPTDAHGLARFDGTALYEHPDPRLGFHPDWNTYIYDWKRPEATNFLLSSALYWMNNFHMDGLRVDAVSSMLYLDYSRAHGEWVPNIHGGNTNLEAVDFLQRLNTRVYADHPGAMMVAEESTAYAGVSRPVDQGGLGFGYKWNLGWMHDTLKYMARDPIHRTWHHDEMTFGLVYAFSENFILALSHDEVVHGKGSIFGRMPGDDDAKFANLCAYYAFMWAHPGKKLLFMGGEFGQRQEWNHDAQLDWACLGDARHARVQALVRKLNGLYRGTPALHQRDCQPSGFGWVQSAARDASVYAFLRWDEAEAAPLLAVFNMTPVVRGGYRVGVPHPGQWRVVLDTAAVDFVGARTVSADATPYDGQPYSIMLDLAGLCGIYLLRAT